MDQLCLTCQLDLGLFTRSDVYYHQLRHHKDHLKPAAPPGALRCPLKPLYDKQGGKIRLRRLQLRFVSVSDNQVWLQLPTPRSTHLASTRCPLPQKLDFNTTLSRE